MSESPLSLVGACPVRRRLPRSSAPAPLGGSCARSLGPTLPSAATKTPPHSLEKLVGWRYVQRPAIPGEVTETMNATEEFQRLERAEILALLSGDREFLARFV